MARPLRLEFAGALYHVTSRGNGRQTIFLDDDDRRRFLEQLGDVVTSHRWECHAYCLMTNHYHLVLGTPEPNLSRGMRRLNSAYAQWFNVIHGRVGHVVQGRFTSILVERESHLLELARYVVLNPVRAGIVVSPERYPWSSLPATLGLAPTPDWLDPGPLLGQFGSRSRYLEFVREGLAAGSPWTELKGVLLGSDPFVDRMAARLRGKAVDPEFPKEQRTWLRPSLPELFPPEARSSRRARNDRIREVARSGQFTAAEISRFLGLHQSTVCRIAAAEEWKGVKP